jgi:hypothetical protein
VERMGGALRRAATEVGAALGGLATSTVVMQNQAPFAPRALDPGAQPQFERMGQQVVAREHADAVVEAAGEAGLHLDPVAMLAVAHVAGVRELV